MGRALLWLAVALAVYTQFVNLISVPGFHFDEAWQANFAERIRTEQGFWPLWAMNSYTSPVVHYFLAGAFSIFNPTLTVLRAAFGVLNIATLFLFVFSFLRMGFQTAAVWFAFGWALLPLFVHNHRFYVEVTSFHGFCLAVIAFAATLLKTRPRTARGLFLFASILGVYSHVLFAVVPFALGIARGELKKEDRGTLGLLMLALLPLALRISFESRKILPLLALPVLVGSAVFFFLSKKDFVFRFPILLKKFVFLCFCIAGALFLVPFWNGFWPYAQATGRVSELWIPINVFFLGYLFFRLSAQDGLLSTLWKSFVICLLATQAIVFKPSPRYYLLASILLLVWVALQASRLKLREQAVWGLLLIAFNLWAFETQYRKAFLKAGPTEKDFRFFTLNDNAKDFRPFQRTWGWLVEKNCQQTFHWLENDRFMHPIDFLRLSAPRLDPKKPACPWTKEELYLSHLPVPEANMEVVVSTAEWGDLAFFVRKPVGRTRTSATKK